ncbi:MAG: hypothetical protein JW939_08470 [Candidatus Thermoplasmatota archaeon]|nr:hypothetical protein [Candidatus Thermoplasmatota archaeon]
MMELREAFIRIGGVFFAGGGLLMIFLSGELGFDPGLAFPGRTAEFLLRAGFGVLILGLLVLFLFSIRVVPQELTDPFLLTQGRNMGRLVKGMNLEGKGVYIPAGGRLREDRVYIPAESNILPIPPLASEQVFNVGTTGPSMGLSIIPPGKALVDRIEIDTGEKFRDSSISDATEALEKLGKGTGLFGSIQVRVRGDSVKVEIENSRLGPVCNILWEDHPDLHEKVGCPGCSAVLTATSRIMKGPLRIQSVERTGKGVVYEMRRGG